MDDATIDSDGRREPAGWWLLGGIATGIVVAVAFVVVASMVFGTPAPAEAMSPPRFVDETATSGIDHVYGGPFSFYVGGGVAVFDCDDDGRPDVFLAGGENPAALYRNESPVGGPLAFSPVASSVTDLTGVTGAYPIDIDDDAVTDLVVLRVGENVVLRGLGDCGFTPADEWGIDGGDAWTVAFSAQWEGAATRPTLAFGNYATLSPDGTKAVGCADHAFIRPDGERYEEPTVLAPGYCTLSILFSDWDGSGNRDLRMTNDRHYYIDGQEQLWRIRQGEVPTPYTEADGWQPMQIWGMGIASYDVTGDGLSEVFLTSQGDNKLQTLAEGAAVPDYEDIAFAMGATAHRPYAGDTTLPSTAWHPEFDDVNNDGYIDLFISKGNVDGQEGFAVEDPNNLLMGGPDGVFTEAGAFAGVDDAARSRGAALVDFDLDGMLDLIVVDRSAPTRIWRNTGSGEGHGHWLALDITQPPPNRNAIGGWLEVRVGDRTERRELTIGGGHAGGQLGWIHVGLGDATEAEVRVTWPDGEVGPWLSVEADRFVIIERGAESAASWSPTPG